MSCFNRSIRKTFHINLTRSKMNYSYQPIHQNPNQNNIKSSLFSWTSKDHTHRQSLSNFKLNHQFSTHESDQKTNQNSPGLFGKLKQLTKLYGSAALVVYGLLGVVDFGLSFLTIYLVGEDHVRIAEDWLLAQLNWKRAATNPPAQLSLTSSETHAIDDNMLWTTAVVAYTIHKTLLLPVRLGLTAWITPPIVRTLRKRGWKVGRNLE